MSFRTTAALIAALLLIMVGADDALSDQPLRGSTRSNELTMRSKIWAWAHEVNAHHGAFGISMESKATPAEGARAFHAGSVLMLMPPSEEQAAQVTGFDQVIWRITSDTGFDFSKSIDTVKALAGKHNNIKGVIIDDLTSTEIGRGMTPEHLAKVREQARSGDVTLELWGVLYTMNFGIPQIGEYMSNLDVVTFWTWEAKDLVDLEANYAKGERVVNGKPIVLGIYVYDFGGYRQMPMDMMRYQCDTALKMLKEGRTKGVILLATCDSDYPIPAVDYAKKWTAEVSGVLDTDPAKRHSQGEK